MLQLNQIIDSLEFLIQNSPVKIVVFTGGEATILGDDLLEAISYCAVRGIPTRLVTNASWATDNKRAEEVLTDLRDAGLYEINFSTDDFHREWIPLENIKRAWMASKGKGFSTVLIAVCCGAQSKTTPIAVMNYLGEKIKIVKKTNATEKNLPDPDSDGTRYLITYSELSRLGRGAHLSEDNFSSCDDLDESGLYGRCCSLTDPLTLNADGTIGLCCGINTEFNSILSLGDAKDILGNPSFELNDFQDLMLRAIEELGPTYLYHLATESALSVRKLKARSVCEVCERLTTDEKILNALKGKAEVIAQQLALSCEVRCQLEMGGKIELISSD